MIDGSCRGFCFFFFYGFDILYVFCPFFCLRIACLLFTVVLPFLFCLFSILFHFSLISRFFIFLFSVSDRHKIKKKNWLCAYHSLSMPMYHFWIANSNKKKKLRRKKGIEDYHWFIVLPRFIHSFIHPFVCVRVINNQFLRQKKKRTT